MEKIRFDDIASLEKCVSEEFGAWSQRWRSRSR